MFNTTLLYLYVIICICIVINKMFQNVQTFRVNAKTIGLPKKQGRGVFIF
jgi:hypothetical protein